jgi:hypothetical protein
MCGCRLHITRSHSTLMVYDCHHCVSWEVMSWSVSV